MSEKKSEKFKPPPPRKEPWPETLGSNPARTSKLGEDPIAEPPLPKVKDSYGRMISTKKANMPYISYGKWKARETAKEERRAKRAEKRARGESLSDWEDDPENSKESDSAMMILLKTLVILLGVVMLMGQFVTGSVVWGYKGKWVRWRTYWPFEGSGNLFTEQMLAKYDGTDPKLPIYIAIDGNVYDVSSNPRTYGPGGSYHLMAGVDAARSFGTGCFKDHRTHDLRGLDQSELHSVDHWKGFFRNSDKYRYVGKVVHPPINPKSPIPEHCEESKRKPAAPKQGPLNRDQKEL